MRKVAVKELGVNYPNRGSSKDFRGLRQATTALRAALTDVPTKDTGAITAALERVERMRQRRVAHLAEREARRKLGPPPRARTLRPRPRLTGRRRRSPSRARRPAPPGASSSDPEPPRPRSVRRAAAHA